MPPAAGEGLDVGGAGSSDGPLKPARGGQIDTGNAVMMDVGWLVVVLIIILIALTLDIAMRARARALMSPEERAAAHARDAANNTGCILFLLVFLVALIAVGFLIGLTAFV